MKGISFYAKIEKRSEAQIPADLRAQSRKLVGDLLDILVTATTQVQNNVLALAHCLGDLHHTPDGVRGLQGGDDTLVLGEGAESSEGLAVVGSDEGGAVGILPVAEFGADTGVVETSRD